MGIDDTIETLSKLHESIEQGIPTTTNKPDKLIDYTNGLYEKFTTSINLAELFWYDQILTPKIHITVYIEEEFDPQKVKQNIGAKLGIVSNRLNKSNEARIEDVAWSYGRYDFMYDERSQKLIVSHPYSHEAKYTNSIKTIIKKMVGYANEYLREVKKSIEENTEIK